MKVLIVFNHPAPYKVNLFNLLAKEVELDVIFERKSASDRPKDFYKGNKYDFNVIFLKHGAFGRENSNTNELKRYLKKHHGNYDLIIMNGYSTISEIKAIHYLTKNNIRFGLYVNGATIRKEGSLKRKLKKYLISSADYYFSPSSEANEALIFYGADLTRIYNYSYSTVFDRQIVDEPVSENKKIELRKKYNLPNGKLFISASQLIERKNVLFLLKCFLGLNEKLLLIGDGVLKDECASFISENKMNNVMLLDFMQRDLLFEYMKASDCFITLSKEDIYGHTINEAFANGIPAISSKNVLAAHHLIKDGYNGYLVDIDEKENIIKTLAEIKPDLLSANSIKTAKENTIEIMAKQHIDIFKRLLK